MACQALHPKGYLGNCLMFLETYSPKYTICFLRHVRYANSPSLSPSATLLGLLSNTKMYLRKIIYSL